MRDKAGDIIGNEVVDKLAHKLGDKAGDKVGKTWETQWETKLGTQGDKKWNTNSKLVRNKQSGGQSRGPTGGQQGINMLANKLKTIFFPLLWPITL